MYTDVSGWILIVCTSIFMLVAAVIDYRTHRIPNKLTLPAFLLGWVYQIYMQIYSQTPGAGLLDGLKGFVIGFGMYFVLWLIGGGGGGDAKLAGAVGVWLGFQKTLAMIVVSTIFVILGTGFVTLWGMLTKGVYKTKNQLLPSHDTSAKSKKRMELLKFNKGRVGMTFALSMALATVVVTLVAVPEWPYRKVAAANRAAREAAQQQKALNKTTNVNSKNTPEKVAPEKKAAPDNVPDKTTEKPETSEKKL